MLLYVIVVFVYNRIRFHYFFTDRESAVSDYHEFYMGKVNSKSEEKSRSIYISDEDLNKHVGFWEALKRTVSIDDTHPVTEITEEDWEHLFDNIPYDDSAGFDLYYEAGRYILPSFRIHDYVTYLGKVKI